ncbi:MAG: EAL domain-containing protein, partial [Acidimicrobiia bacterium]|nr:EAL domain-containing protein [Acidimicrobiia bacterium]
RIDRLAIEITETHLASDLGAAALELAELRRAGVVLVVDDFGSGYSSLSYLQSFLASVVKLDGYYVRNMGADPRACAMAEAVVAVAHAFGMHAVAEQVETIEQADMARAMGYPYGQGFLFGRPAPLDELEAQLRARLGPSERARPGA